LNRIDLGWHAVLVPPEVDHPVLLFMTAAAMPRRDLALVVAAASLGLRTQQRLLRLRPWRKLGKVAHRRATKAGSNRIVFANAHDSLIKPAMVSPVSFKRS
jgi:hypothetical protein